MTLLDLCGFISLTDFLLVSTGFLTKLEKSLIFFLSYLSQMSSSYPQSPTSPSLNTNTQSQYGPRVESRGTGQLVCCHNDLEAFITLHTSKCLCLRPMRWLAVWLDDLSPITQTPNGRK